MSYLRHRSGIQSEGAYCRGWRGPIRCSTRDSKRVEARKLTLRDRALQVNGAAAGAVAIKFSQQPVRAGDQNEIQRNSDGFRTSGGIKINLSPAVGADAIRAPGDRLSRRRGYTDLYPIRSTVPPVMLPLPLAVRVPTIIKNNGAVLESNPVDENTYVPFRLLVPKLLPECAPVVDELLPRRQVEM